MTTSKKAPKKVPDGAVSIVVPVFNEARSIAEVIADLKGIVEARPGSELVVVDDGSTDETPGVLSEIARTDARVKVVRSEHNRGHGPSLRTGLEQTRCPWLFLADGDGQIPATEFEALWSKRATADLVMGRRVGRSEPPHRRALSRGVRALASRAGRADLSDANVPFKLVRRELWEDLRPHIPDEPATPSLLIAVGAALRGWRIEGVRVRHEPRTNRTSTLSAGRLVRLSARAAVELFSFRRRVLGAAPRAATEMPVASTK